MRRASVVLYFVLASTIVGWMMWHDLHLPKCLKLYGVGSANDSVDLFLSCSQSNDVEVMRVQMVGVVLIFVVAILIVGIEGIRK